MQISEVLIDAFGRIQSEVETVLVQAEGEALGIRVDPDANSIAWLIWHLTRVQDDHLAKAFGVEQVWMAGGWAELFGLPFPAPVTGYYHSSDEVGELSSVGYELLGSYHRATFQQTTRLLRGVTTSDLDRIVDTNWTPPVTLGVRLVSVISDCLQHVGQAAYVCGLV